jgi:2-oxoglutarate dehydrogenase E1 component
VWVQEESQNMGGWSFVEPRLRALLGHEVHYVGRDASASPATGSRQVHVREQKELIEDAIRKTGTHVVGAQQPGIRGQAAGARGQRAAVGSRLVGHD